jgi:hypothetical protein
MLTDADWNSISDGNVTLDLWRSLAIIEVQSVEEIAVRCSKGSAESETEDGIDDITEPPPMNRPTNQFSTLSPSSHLRQRTQYTRRAI